jgi:hypothetical protein
MLANDFRGIAQNVRGVLDGAACHQDLSGQRVTKAMRLGIPHAALREYSLEGPHCGLDMAIAGTYPGREEVLAIRAYT